MPTTISPAIPAPGSSVMLDDVSWEAYESLRQETDDQGSHVRISYDNGRMVLMSPLPKHEWFKTRVGRLIEAATLEWNIPIYSLGSTTWKRRDLRKGLEADECYYIQREADVRGRDDLDLTRDPPPDLAIEVDVTNSSRRRQAIYAGLGIREIWRYDGKRTEFLKLQADAEYHPIERSEALPRFTPAVIDRFLAMFGAKGETEIMREFRDWARSG